MARLTKQIVDAAEPRAAAYFIWDATLPGFGLRVHPTGKRIYYADFRNRDGVRRRMKIGAHGRVTTEEARKIALQILGDVVKGEDPAQERATRRNSLTVAELCARLEFVEAVVITDAALDSGRLRTGQLESWADTHAGFPGVRKVRRVISNSDTNAESPMESRLRLVLVLGGLPRPQAQVTIRDRWGRALGRPDLYYADERLGIEYDGGTHRDALVDDNRRQNRLLSAGVRLLRFTSGDVLANPNGVVAQVRSMLEHHRVPANAGLDGLN